MSRIQEMIIDLDAELRKPLTMEVRTQLTEIIRVLIDMRDNLKDMKKRLDTKIIRLYT